MKETYYKAQGRQFKSLQLNVQENSGFSWWNFIKKIFYIVLIASIGYLIYWAYDKYYYVRIYQAPTLAEHYLFSLLNLSIFGGFLISIYNSDGISSKTLKIIALLAVIVIGILGIERFGLSIWINAPILRYQYFISNGPESIQFFFQNLALFTTIFGASFLIETNK